MTTDNTHLTDREFLSRAEVMRRLPAHLRKFDPAPNGCWIYRSRGANGYATNTSYKGRKASPYKIIWEIVNDRQLVGGYIETLHHLCDNGPGGCVNPNHLVVVTQSENMRASTIAPAGRNAHKTHCEYGHPFTPENTYDRPETTGRGRNGGRGCRECRRRRQRERLERLASTSCITEGCDGAQFIKGLCRRHYEQTRVDKIREQKRRYREANRERIRETQRQWKLRQREAS